MEGKDVPEESQNVADAIANEFDEWQIRFKTSYSNMKRLEDNIRVLPEDVVVAYAKQKFPVVADALCGSDKGSFKVASHYVDGMRTTTRCGRVPLLDCGMFVVAQRGLDVLRDRNPLSKTKPAIRKHRRA